MNLKRISIAVAAMMAAVIVYYFYPGPRLPPTITVDALVVNKHRQQLLAYARGQLVKTYSISLGGAPAGAKQFEGDQRTPEGIYYIYDKNPNSSCYKNLGISYPGEKDMAAARRAGKSPGGSIKIHGLNNRFGFIGKFHRWYNWTHGCIAVTNEEMDELYSAVPVGTKIEIRP